MARPFLPLPPDYPRSFSASRIAFATFTLTLRLSLFLSLSLTITVHSLLRLRFSFPRAAPACLPVFLFSSSGPCRSLPSAVALARGTLPTRPPRSPYLPPHPSRVPAHPYKKLKSSVGATGGFSLRFLLPSSHHSSFTSLLTFSRPFPFPLLCPFSCSIRAHSLLSLLRAVHLRFVRSESVALSHFIMRRSLLASTQALVILNHCSNADDSVTMRFS